MKLGTAIVTINTAITAFAISNARDIERVTELGDRIRSTTTEIEKLIYIAGLTGSDENSVLSSLDNLSELIGQAATGVGGAQNLFLQYGLEARKANGEIKTTFEMMRELRGLLVRMAEPQRVAFLSNLGIDPTLMKALTDDTSRFAAEFENLYKIIGVDSKEASVASNDLMDTIFRLTFIFDAVKKKIAVEVMPLITKSFETLRLKLISYIPFIIDKVTFLIKKFLEFVDVISEIGRRTALTFKPIWDWLVKLNEATDGWLVTIGFIILAWKQLNLSFLTSPLGIILSIAFALTQLKDDFDTFNRGGEAFFDWSGDMGEAMETLMVIMEWLGDALENVFIRGMKAIKNFMKYLKGDLKDSLTDSKAWLDDFLLSPASDKNPSVTEPKMQNLLDNLNLIGETNPFYNKNKSSTAPIINNNTTINVNGSEPVSTGRAVAREQASIFGNLFNSFKTILQ
jgi:hypothetical protein